MGKKGSKDIKVTGMEDKRQVTCCVSSAANGVLLPMQIIFTGKTVRCLPKTHAARICLDYGFHLTMSTNHWSNLQTCQQFVRCILVPYFEHVVKEMGLPQSQKMIWLLDCWSVHKYEAFLTWMKKNTLAFVFCLYQLIAHQSSNQHTLFFKDLSSVASQGVINNGPQHAFNNNWRIMSLMFNWI